MLETFTRRALISAGAAAVVTPGAAIGGVTGGSRHYPPVADAEVRTPIASWMRMVGDSMQPRYDDGERLLATSSGRPIAPGDFIAFEAGKGWHVRLLIALDETAMTVKRLNPATEETVDRRQISSTLRILSNVEAVCFFEEQAEARQ